jgi:hypothetical protein
MKKVLFGEDKEEKKKRLLFNSYRVHYREIVTRFSNSFNRTSQTTNLMQQYLSKSVCWSPNPTPPMFELTGHGRSELKPLKPSLLPIIPNQAGNVSGWQAWVELSLAAS